MRADGMFEPYGKRGVYLVTEQRLRDPVRVYQFESVQNVLRLIPQFNLPQAKHHLQH